MHKNRRTRFTRMALKSERRRRELIGTAAIPLSRNPCRI
jgi:hypothetical protein